MIKIEHVSKSYKNVNAVKDFSLSILDKEIFALLGLNGAGKSTLMNILCGLTQKDSGKVWVNDLDLDTSILKIKQIIGLAPQENAIANNLTVEENLEFVANLYGVSDVAGRVAQIISKLKLESKTKTLAKKLSGGQKRRLNLGMALISNPQVLILDEPTLGLDVKSRRELWDIIKDYKREHTIIFTTHYLEEAENFADRIGIITKGELKVCGTKDEILAKSKAKSFEDAFLKFAGGDDE